MPSCLARSRFDRTSRCPLCRRHMVESDLRVLAEEESEETGPAAAPVQRKVSIKLLSVFDRIERIKEARPTARVVVFSQYVGTLSRLIEMCPHETCHIDGSMPQRRRAKELERFLAFLGASCSCRCGAGLDQLALRDGRHPGTVPERVAEDQAIGRVHRMGQRQEGDVYVHHWCCCTIEERIMRARGALSSTAKSVCCSRWSNCCRRQRQKIFFLSDSRCGGSTKIMLLDTAFWTSVQAAIAYSVAYGKTMPGLVAAIGAAAWFMLHRLERRDKAHVVEELQADKAEEEQEKEVVERIEVERKERTRSLAWTSRSKIT